MESRELLRYLEKLEIGLSTFSYEELGIVEAGQLKRSFEVFRDGLEEKVFGLHETKRIQELCDELGIQNPGQNALEHAESCTNSNQIQELMDLVRTLELTDLNSKQKNLVASIKKMAATISENNRTGGEMDGYLSSMLKSPSDKEAMSLRAVLKICMDDMELLELFITSFRQDALEFIGRFRVSLNKSEFNQLEVICQKIMPSLKMLESNGLIQIVKQMETACKTNQDAVYLNFLYEQFLMEYPKIEKNLDSELNILRNM